MIQRRFYLIAPALVTALLAASLGDAADPAAAVSRKKLTGADIDRMMASVSNWKRWGADDQQGALNLITPAKRRSAAALVKEGITVSMAHNVIKEAVDDSPAFLHQVILPRQGQEITSAGDEYSVRYHGFTQTHIDALSHLFYKGKMYNGFSQDELTSKGAGKLGVQQMKNGIFTRCVLMDMPRLFGTRFLEGTRAIYPEDLEAWERKAGVKVQSGDAVVIRTGRWARRELDGPWNIMKNSAGLHASCVPWLKKRDAAVVGSDLALDVLPSGIDGVELPVHWLCIIALGTPILDNCDLEKVAEEANARKRWAFLLTVAPLAVEGGTGSPINPLATF